MKKGLFKEGKESIIGHAKEKDLSAQSTITIINICLKRSWAIFKTRGGRESAYECVFLVDCNPFSFIFLCKELLIIAVKSP